MSSVDFFSSPEGAGKLIFILHQVSSVPADVRGAHDMVGSLEIPKVVSFVCYRQMLPITSGRASEGISRSSDPADDRRPSNATGPGSLTHGQHLPVLESPLGVSGRSWGEWLPSQ